MAIYKTRNVGMGNGMGEMQGTRGIFTGNLLEDSGECSRKFQGMLLKISGNAIKDSGRLQQESGECSERFRGMLSILN